MTALQRVFLLGACLLAAYQVALGIEGLPPVPTLAFTIAFGVLLVAGLLLIILGFEGLDSPVVVILSTLIPLSLATGLVWQHLPALRVGYLVYAAAGLLAVAFTRPLVARSRLPVLVLAVVHGIAGLTIFLLPILWAAAGRAAPGFFWVGVGGGLMGLGGLLLALLKTGRELLSREKIFRLFPGLLLLMTSALVAGFALA